MATTLHDLCVPTVLQRLRAVAGILARAADHCADIGIDADDLVAARLFPDMAPLHFQVEALKNHAVWGLEAIATGVFAPPPLIGRMPFAALRAMMRTAISTVGSRAPETLDRHAGRRQAIEVFLPLDWTRPDQSPWGPRRLDLTSEDFVLSYTLPNVHFHAVTAHNILRAQGVPIGKGDYLIQFRPHPA